MKKLAVLCLLLGAFAFASPARAADEAVFSATSDKSSYVVGDDITISLNVDAGPYSTTLTVIDFKVKVSDPSVVEPVGSSPLTLGSIYTNTVTQSYSNGVMSAVVFIDPNNKPANRSGVIGTIAMKAKKAGQAVISYDSIQATDENDQLEYITTSASSLTVNVTSGSGAQTTTTATSGSSTSGTSSSSTSSGTAAKTKTATAQPSKATTGPKEALIFSIITATLLLVAIKYSRKLKISRKI